MARSNTVVVKFIADVAAMRKGIDKVNGQLSGFQRNVARVGGALAAAFSAREVTQFVGESIKAFASYEESLSRIGVVFGDQAADIIKWGEANANAMLLSKEQAVGYLGQLGAILNQSGLTADETSRFSKELVTLIGDLSSFADVPVEQAANAVRGAIVGEREALKTLGFPLTEATVKSLALRDGIIKQGEALEGNKKVLANINALLSQTALAQGDAARTGDSLANQLKKVEGNVADLRLEFGGAFLEALGGGEDGVKDLNATLEDLTPAVQLLARGLASVVSPALEVGKVIAALSPLFEKTGEAGLALTDAFDSVGLAAGGIIGTGFAWEGELERVIRIAGAALNPIKALGAAAGFATSQLDRYTDSASKFSKEKAFSLQGYLSDQAAAQERVNQAETDALRIQRETARARQRQSNAYKQYYGLLDKTTDSTEELTRATGGSSRAAREFARTITDTFGQYSLAVELNSNKIEKLTKKQDKALERSYNQAIKVVKKKSDELDRLRTEIVTTTEFISNVTERLLGPTSLEAVQGKYEAALTKTEGLTVDLAKAEQALADARARGNQGDIDRQVQEVNNLKTALQEATSVSDQGFIGFWEKAQEKVRQYQEQLRTLTNSEFIPRNEAAATFFQGLLSASPDVGKQIITELLAEGQRTAATIQSQQDLIKTTKTLATYVTDAWAGNGGGFPAVGYTTGKSTIEELTAYLNSNKTKKKVRKAVRNAVPETVKVRVTWDVPPPPIPEIRARGTVSPTDARSAVSNLMKYERMNGTRWREIR